MPSPTSTTTHPRVILIDPDPVACKVTSDQLRSLGFEVVAADTDPHQAFDLATRLLPDIVVLDGDVEGFSICEAITTTLVDVEVILILDNHDPRSVRQAMLAGARDYLVRPYAIQEIATSLTRLHQLAVGRKKEKPVLLPPPTPVIDSTRSASAAGGKIIAVYSPKGGVGCTTVSVNLAVALAVKFRIALVDADLQFGDVALLLNLKPRHSIADLNAVSSLEPESVHRVLEQHASGVKVLTAPPRPELADLVATEAISGALDTLAQSFDYVIVDCGKTLGEHILSVLDRAQVVLLVCTPDIEVLKNLRLYLDLAPGLQHLPEKYKIILNKDDPKGLLSRGHVQKYLHRAVDMTLPRDWNTARVAASVGVPFVLSQTNELLAGGIRRLASMLTRKPNLVETASQIIRCPRALIPTNREVFRSLIVALSVTAAIILALFAITLGIQSNLRQRAVPPSTFIPMGQAVATSTGVRLAVIDVQRPFASKVLPLPPGEQLSVVSLWIENTRTDAAQTIRPEAFYLATPWNEIYSPYLLEAKVENHLRQSESIPPTQGFIRKLIFYVRADVGDDLHLVWRTSDKNFEFAIKSP